MFYPNEVTAKEPRSVKHVCPELRKTDQRWLVWLGSRGQFGQFEWVELANLGRYLWIGWAARTLWTYMSYEARSL